MKITRREFIPAFAAFAAGCRGLANTPKTDQKEKTAQEEKVDAAKELDSAAIKTLRLADPNLTNLIISLTYCFTEPIVFHKINYEKLKKGIGSISESDLIHNNSDRWANAMASTMSYFLAYAGRFPFTVWIAKESSNSSEERKRQSRVFSDFMTINTYYGQTLADRYLTNAFQHELRESYKKLLKENPEYKYQPWAIPMSKTIQTLRDITPTVKNEIVRDVKTSINNFKEIKNEKVALEWVQSRKNQLNLLLIFLSYASTFVDYIPLATANKVPIYTANTATGRIIANLPCQYLLCNDLLKRLKAKGDIEGYHEEKVMASAGLYNGPLYYAVNSSIQSTVDSVFNLKKLSDKEIAYSNLREIIGAVNGCIVFMFLQYKLESTIREKFKNQGTETERKSLATRFANWYIESHDKKSNTDSSTSSP